MNLRQVRKKIKSIRNVRKITRAMQLVSAIKMRKAQEVEIEGRPYRDTLSAVIQKLTASFDFSLSELFKVKSQKDRRLVILISSNKGLSGSFLVNLFRFLVREHKDLSDTEFVSVGNKGAVFVQRLGGTLVADFSKGVPLSDVTAIFSFALEKYMLGEYKRVIIAYNKFISTFRFEPTQELLLPFTFKRETEVDKRLLSEYLIEPSPEEIIGELLKNYLEEQIRGAIISSEACEHSARMLAMKNATDNATDIIYNLTLVGNKLRQEKITGELLDMITAKESVEIS